jgi:hypothetical protein
MISNPNMSLNLRLIKKCPVCELEYKQSMIQVLDENEFGILTYASCLSCGANLLTKFASMSQGVIGNAILTDLKAHEVVDFANNDSLSSDDVLDIYDRLDDGFLNNLRKINK